MTKTTKPLVSFADDQAPAVTILNEGIETRTAGTLVANAIEDLEVAKERLKDHPDQSAVQRIKRALAAVAEIKTALPASEAAASPSEQTED